MFDQEKYDIDCPKCEYSNEYCESTCLYTPGDYGKFYQLSNDIKAVRESPYYDNTNIISYELLFCPKCFNTLIKEREKWLNT